MYILYVRVLVFSIYHSIYHTSYQVFIFCFCVPFASLWFREPAAAEPNTIFVLLLLPLLVRPPLRCCASSCRCCLYASCSNNLFFLLFLLNNIYMTNFTDKKSSFLSPQVAGTSGWREKLY